LKWFELDFLAYMDSWREYAISRNDLKTEDKSKTMFSAQTLEGLKITVYSFVEVLPYLLSLDVAAFNLNERFNQDTLEAFFGKQRGRCGRGDNPNVT
jgi:hypothetical protein